MFAFLAGRSGVLGSISACLLVLGLLPAANAASFDSAYTKIKLENCTLIRPPADESTDGGRFQCAGYKGIPVYVAEGDLRMFVSFGPDAEHEPAAHSTLPNFNTVNETLEWRLRNGAPIATILSWFPSLDESGKTGSILIVTQLMPGGRTCWIAQVDAQANKNANVLARQAADTMAGTSNCTQQPAIIGNPGIFR